jgi:hypothetical protein
VGKARLAARCCKSRLSVAATRTCTAEKTAELIHRLAGPQPDRQITAKLTKQRRRTGTGLLFCEPRVKTSAAEQHFAVRPDGTRLPSRTNPEPGQLRRPTQAPRGFRASAGEEWKCSPLERAPPRDGMECLDQGRSERRHDEIRDRPSPKAASSPSPRCKPVTLSWAVRAPPYPWCHERRSRTYFSRWSRNSPWLSGKHGHLYGSDNASFFRTS